LDKFVGYGWGTLKTFDRITEVVAKHEHLIFYENLSIFPPICKKLRVSKIQGAPVRIELTVVERFINS